MRRFGVVMAIGAATIVVAFSAAFHPAPRLIWNASSSVPIGLYAMRPAGVLRVADLVIVRPPEPLASFFADRGYLPDGVPLLKRVLALPGQTVCRTDRTITVERIAVGTALERDRRGRALPDWQGCHTVASDEIFLMNRQSEDSFDGRYFGTLPAAAVVGRADPLWTAEER